MSSEPSHDDHDELHHWVALHSLDGMGPVAFRRLVERFGSARAVLEDADRSTLGEIRDLPRSLAEAILNSRHALDAARRSIETLQKRGVRIVRMGAESYPPALLDLSNPPPVLYVVGDVTPEDYSSVGMVGTTKPSDRGRGIAEEFARRLGQAGITVVSGYAHGIDAASHRGAFRGGGRSILCLPYGIRHYKSRPDFPPLREIAQRGGLVTECPPDHEWSSRAAVARNRIIAALSRALFVVETRTRGGTMHTVKAAEQLRRPIFALRYQNAPENARGNSILIARNATPVSTFGEAEKIIACVRDTVK